MKIEKNHEKIKNIMNQSFYSELIPARFVPNLELHHYEKGEWLVKEGADLAYLWVLTEGKTKVYMTHQNGRVSILDFAVAPTIFGELSLLGVETYTKGIQAMTSCSCLALPIDRYKNTLLQDSQFLYGLAKFLGTKMLQRTELANKSLNYPLENRLAAFILLTEKGSGYEEKHTEVAEYLNISYRHLLYTLKQFCEEGILKKHGRSYLIADRLRLNELASEVQVLNQW